MGKDSRRVLAIAACIVLLLYQRPQIFHYRKLPPPAPPGGTHRQRIRQPRSPPPPPLISSSATLPALVEGVYLLDAILVPRESNILLMAMCDSLGFGETKMKNISMPAQMRRPEALALAANGCRLACDAIDLGAGHHSAAQLMIWAARCAVAPDEPKSGTPACSLRGRVVLHYRDARGVEVGLGSTPMHGTLGPLNAMKAHDFTRRVDATILDPVDQEAHTTPVSVATALHAGESRFVADIVSYYKHEGFAHVYLGCLASAAPFYHRLLAPFIREQFVSVLHIPIDGRFEFQHAKPIAWNAALWHAKSFDGLLVFGDVDDIVVSRRPREVTATQAIRRAVAAGLEARALQQQRPASGAKGTKKGVVVDTLATYVLQPIPVPPPQRLTIGRHAYRAVTSPCRRRIWCTDKTNAYGKSSPLQDVFAHRCPLGGWRGTSYNKAVAAPAATDFLAFHNAVDKRCVKKKKATSEPCPEEPLHLKLDTSVVMYAHYVYFWGARSGVNEPSPNCNITTEFTLAVRARGNGGRQGGGTDPSRPTVVAELPLPPRPEPPEVESWGDPDVVWKDGHHHDGPGESSNWEVANKYCQKRGARLCDIGGYCGDDHELLAPPPRSVEERGAVAEFQFSPIQCDSDDGRTSNCWVNMGGDHHDLNARCQTHRDQHGYEPKFDKHDPREPLEGHLRKQLVIPGHVKGDTQAAFFGFVKCCARRKKDD